MMNANQKITKIKKYARIGSIVTALFTAIWIVVSLFFSALSVYLVFNYQNDAIQELTQSILYSFLHFGNDAFSASSNFLLVLIIACAALTFKALMYLAVFEHIRRILRDVASHDSPFEIIHVNRLKRIALFIFLGSFVNFMSIQINEWIVAFVVLFLALILDYGCQLQQESDETL